MPDEVKLAQPNANSSPIAAIAKLIVTSIFSQAGAVGLLLLVVLYGGFHLFMKNIESHQLIVDKFNATMLEMQSTDADNRAKDREKMEERNKVRTKNQNDLIRGQTKILENIDRRLDEHHKVEEKLLEAIKKIGSK